MALQVRRDEFQGAETVKGTRGREPQAQADVRGLGAGPSNGKGGHRKKALKPCRKRAITKELVHYGISRARPRTEHEQERLLLPAFGEGRHGDRGGLARKSQGTLRGRVLEGLSPFAQ